MGKLKRFVKSIVKRIVFFFPSSYILMFHHISEDIPTPRSGCILEWNKFISLIESYQNYASVKDIVTYKKKNILGITFDDGLIDVYTKAYPYLVSKGIPFTIFVVTDFLDKEGYITTDNLIEMSRNPLVTIGSHGVSHELLSKMSRDLQEKELVLSQKRLKLITGRDIDCVAFSHGAYNSYTLELTDKYYEYGFSVIEHPINRIMARNTCIMPRINVDNTTYSLQINFLKKYYRGR